jgi:large subunit ribosomal protein L23
MKTLPLAIPMTTEKAYAQSQNNVYVFEVPLTANKQEISAGVEAQFNVKVERIKTLVQTGKSMRFSRGKRSYPGTTKRTDSKKAYVTLAAGNSINVFETPAEEAAAAKPEKKEKK